MLVGNIGGVMKSLRDLPDHVFNIIYDHKNKLYLRGMPIKNLNKLYMRDMSIKNIKKGYCLVCAEKSDDVIYSDGDIFFCGKCYKRRHGLPE